MAQIEFFSSEIDDKRLFEQIAKDDTIKCSVVENGKLTDWIYLRDLVVPNEDLHFELCIWKSDLGKLKWISNKPNIDSSSHSKLVKTIFTREHWIKQKATSDINRMIDDQKSPIIYYKRGRKVYGYNLPNIIVTPQSSIKVLGSDFEKWFNQISSWIRRNSKLIYNWKMKDCKLRNDLKFANSIYSMENAFRKLELNETNYAISINTHKYDK